MGAIKPIETFRGDYTFANSETAIARFPFPYPEDSYMYSVNMEPHDAGPAGSVTEHPLDIDEHYLGEVNDRRLVLEQDPGRCQCLPHMMQAQWDTLEFIMETYADSYPQFFSLSKDGDRWTWVNRLLDLQQTFVFGDLSTLPCPPFEYITRQAQGDFVLLDQRDDNLYMDGGIATSQADWSIGFDVGMDFFEWHGPVPLAHGMGVFDRALKFLCAMQPGRPTRRLNWTMTVNPRLDTSPENYHLWGSDRAMVTPDNAGEKCHLRVELQSLFRLPRSHALLFSVRCYLISLEDLATRPKWVKRMHRVLRDLHPALADYKGISRYRDAAVAWLAQHDDGAPLSRGTAAD